MAEYNILPRKENVTISMSGKEYLFLQIRIFLVRGGPRGWEKRAFYFSSVILQSISMLTILYKISHFKDLCKAFGRLVEAFEGLLKICL